MIALLVDVGQGIDRGGRPRGRSQAGASEVVVVDARDEFAARLRAAGAAGRRPVRGPLPAGLGALAAADRAAHGGGRPRVRRRRGRPRLHRQGQRPGAVRDGGGRARARPGGARAGARLGHDPRAGDRLRRAARHRGPGQVGRRLLDRPQPVGPLDRGRPARGSLDRAARGRVRADHRRRSGRCPRRRRSRSRSSRACRSRSTASALDLVVADRPGRRARRRPRRRSHRHDREPAGRHQEPRGLRGAGRGAAADRLRRASRSWWSSATSPTPRRSWRCGTRPWSTTASGSRRCGRRCRRSWSDVAAAVTGEVRVRLFRGCCAGGRAAAPGSLYDHGAGHLRGGRRLPARRGGRLHPRLVAPTKTWAAAADAAATVEV